MTAKQKEIIYVVGEESKRWEFDSGIVILYREPTTREIINYRDQIKYRRSGKGFTAQSAERQIALADAIIEDVEGIGFKDKDGKVKRLERSVSAAEISHLKVDGTAPRGWKDLVPANLKCQFIDGLMGGIEEEEKN